MNSSHALFQSRMIAAYLWPHFDNAAADAFFSSLEWEVLSRHEFANTGQARAVVLDWCYGLSRP
jgi:hypothetical protein